jgi:hypothetical protein
MVCPTQIKMVVRCDRVFQRGFNLGFQVPAFVFAVSMGLQLRESECEQMAGRSDRR